MAADVPDVQAFLDRHWKPRHILTTDRALFDWQYARPDRPGEYSIVLARNDADGTIAGMLGFLSTSRFDPALAQDNAIWLALWKVRDDVPAGALGLKLLSDLTEHEPHASIGVIGFQPPVAAIYKALKFQVGELQHYVLPNPDVSSFELASFERAPQRTAPSATLAAVPLDDRTLSDVAAAFDPGPRATVAPRKTVEYFRARFLKHPRYRYLAFALRHGERTVALAAARLAAHAGRRALRIVDFIGPEDAIASLGAVALREVRRLDCEYADIHNWGIDSSRFEEAGFTRIDPNGADIVPNHFEPFERRNATIRFALKSDRPAVLFKGDGDQDRPNQPTAS